MIKSSLIFKDDINNFFNKLIKDAFIFVAVFLFILIFFYIFIYESMLTLLKDNILLTQRMVNLIPTSIILQNRKLKNQLLKSKICC